MTQSRTTAPATFLLRQCKFKNIFSVVREDCLLFTLCLLLAASVVTSCSNSPRIATNERGNTQIKTTKMTTKTFTRPDDETLRRQLTPSNMPLHNTLQQNNHIPTSTTKSFVRASM